MKTKQWRSISVTCKHHRYQAILLLQKTKVSNLLQPSINLLHKLRRLMKKIRRRIKLQLLKKDKIPDCGLMSKFSLLKSSSSKKKFIRNKYQKLLHKVCRKNNTMNFSTRPLFRQIKIMRRKHLINFNRKRLMSVKRKKLDLNLRNQQQKRKVLTLTN